MGIPPLHAAIAGEKDRDPCRDQCRGNNPIGQAIIGQPRDHTQVYRDSVTDVCGCIDPCAASQSSTLCRGHQAFWYLHRVHRHVPLADLMGSANVNYGVSVYPAPQGQERRASGPVHPTHLPLLHRSAHFYVATLSIAVDMPWRQGSYFSYAPCGRRPGLPILSVTVA